MHLKLRTHEVHILAFRLKNLPVPPRAMGLICRDFLPVDLPHAPSGEATPAPCAPLTHPPSYPISLAQPTTAVPLFLFFFSVPLSCLSAIPPGLPPLLHDPLAVITLQLPDESEEDKSDDRTTDRGDDDGVDFFCN